MRLFKGSFPLIAKANSQACCENFHPITISESTHCELTSWLLRGFSTHVFRRRWRNFSLGQTEDENFQRLDRQNKYLQRRMNLISMSKFFAGGGEMMEWKTALKGLIVGRRNSSGNTDGCTWVILLNTPPPPPPSSLNFYSRAKRNSYSRNLICPFCPREMFRISPRKSGPGVKRVL